MKKISSILLLVLFVASCSQTNSPTQEQIPQTTQSENPNNNWIVKVDTVNDFGDAQFIATNSKINSAQQRLELVVACTAGLFEFWLESDAFIPDVTNQAAKIRFDGEDPDIWSIDKRATPPSGVFAVRIRDSEALFREIMDRESLSVKLNGEGNSFISATFPLEGVTGLVEAISRSGCKIEEI